jgi:hypothetical protein
MRQGVLGFVGALAGFVLPRSRRRAQLRASWGKVGDGDGWLVSRLFDLITRTDTQARWVDDKTWVDLEFPRIFSHLNTTITALGGQYLYKLLRSYQSDPRTLSQRHAIYQCLRNDVELREDLQLILSGLEANSAAYIADILFGAPPAIPKYPLLIYTWALLCVLLLVAAAVFSLGPWILIGVLLVNGVVLYTTSKTVYRDSEALTSCRRMLLVADRLTAVRPHEAIPELADLRSDRRKRSRLRRELRWLGFFWDNTSLLGGVLVWVSWVFLGQLVAYTHSVRRFVRSRPDWVSTFEAVGSIDAAIAVAGFLHRTPKHCRPTVTDAALIAIEDGYHPLLANPICNSVTLDRRSALITGSNLVGKTTFVKMVGTNIIFGRTLGICLASKATIPRSGVMASIRGEQSVESGKSRYESEVDAIGRFIRSASRGECRVFVIDELFSGTNTVERIAVAKAVLEAISDRAQVLATTHDVELQHLLSDRFDLFHFREDPSVDGFFDYRLRSGTSSERNAIRVMERMGFPREIVEAALAQVNLGKGLDG